MANKAQSMFVPTDRDAILAGKTSRALAMHVRPQENLKVNIVEDNGDIEEVILPATAVRFLLDILTQMSMGNAFTLIPIHAELTTQQAADLCNVSRPFLISAIERGELDYKKVGTHRRLRFKEVMSFKEKMDKDRSNALDELVKEAQELDMGY